jgi:predicted nucleic acid-binding protein
MTFADIFSSPTAVTFIVLGLMVAFYMARDSAHNTIRSLSRVLRNGFRMSAKALVPVEHLVALRNREVLLAAGRELKERDIEREFERIESSVKKELADTPSLCRMVQEEVAKLEDDYQKCTEVPPSPPGWVKAVEAVASIKGDAVVEDILADIHESLKKAHEETTKEYRHSRRERHNLLKGMMPLWRKVLDAVNTTDKNVSSLLERVKVIDRYMDDYEQILNGTDRAVRSLSESSFRHFFISTLVLAIAIGGAMINFNLIAHPMSEMVGASNYISIFSFDHKVSDIAALVIILVEITLGLFLMECLRITRLFPVIGSLKDSTRQKMVWFTFTALFSLASIEAGLAYMREMLTQDSLATAAVLRGQAASVIDNGYTWITTAAQMGLGFVLPFALVFVAIPLETFVASLRSVVGAITVFLIRSAAFSLRVIGNAFYHLGSTMIHIYDLAVFLPLWVEKMIKNRKNGPVEVVNNDRRKVELKEAS